MYDWILFDADDTLFSFDSYAGLKHMLASHGMDFSAEDFAEYQELNKALWIQVQNGRLTQKEVQYLRFEKWAQQINSSRKSASTVSPQELNNSFLDSMALTSKQLEGVVSLLNAIKGKAKLGIITNGFVRLQQARLNNLGLAEYFDAVIISESVGVAKPHPAIFDHALEQMGNPSRERVLMVGDTFESDILGGINSGLHTCWFNPHQKNTTHDAQPTYQVASAKELELLLRSCI